MAFTQADIDLLKKKIVSGVKSVVYSDGRRIDYDTTSAMIVALAIAEAEVAAAGSAGGVSYVSISKD